MGKFELDKGVYQMTRLVLFLFVLFSVGGASAHDFGLETIVVEGRQINLVGDAISASEGIVGQAEISLRPIGRSGEVLELIPGMVVTQHSGSGKANQYFLRGFNLDHGSDFATIVDGMPVNMRSHGHGQGYTDLSFLIPETIALLSYRKGAYYADVGDFSGAGGVRIELLNQVSAGEVRVTSGKEGYQRAVVIHDVQTGVGQTLFALERQHYDGPWSDVAEDIRKTNLAIRYSRPMADGEMNVTFMGYDNTWNSADQIPVRAVQQGLIDRFGSIDDSVGGESSRYSLSVKLSSGVWHGSAYLIDYNLNLWSNFTYFLDDPVNGDQFEQVDDRRIFGGELEYRSDNHRLGIQVQADDIAEVGLYQALRRERLGVTRSDEINQNSVSLYWENRKQWSGELRTVLGARYDLLRFDVEDRVGVNRFGVDVSPNAGTTNDDIASFKGNLIYSLSDAWEVYASAGQGFHSNDARGTTIVVDPTSGVAADQVDPLVRSTGFELGTRGFVSDQLNISAAVWTLRLDSELLFVGDVGNTEASRPSERRGIEAVVYYHFTDYLSADFEYAYTDAEFRDDDPTGDNIPGAVRDVLQAGLNANFGENWSGSLRFRYFGNRPLAEDGRVESDATSTLNLRVGYRQDQWQATLDVFNLSDRRDNNIAYLYASRLLNEVGGDAVEDVHFHPVEPRAVRLSLKFSW